METIRHNYNLYWEGKLIIAPRKFVYNGYTYYVHIVGEFCSKVLVFIQVRKHLDGFVVGLCTYYKTYSNTKGLYFNFNKKRIYLGE